MSDAIEVRARYWVNFLRHHHVMVIEDAEPEHTGDCTCGGCACSMCGSNAMTCDGQCQQDNSEAQQESAAPVSGAPST